MVQEIYIIDNNNELIEKLKESFKRELDENLILSKVSLK